jgi:translocation protein SEC62
MFISKKLLIQTGLLFLRIIVYFIAYLFGYEIWILPNLLDEKMSFVEGLTPIIAYYPRDDSRGEIAIRIILFLGIVSFGVLLYFNQQYIIDIYDLTKYCFDSVLDWGNSKITDMHVRFNIT